MTKFLNLQYANAWVICRASVSAKVKNRVCDLITLDRSRYSLEKTLVEEVFIISVGEPGDTGESVNANSLYFCVIFLSH